MRLTTEELSELLMCTDGYLEGIDEMEMPDIVRRVRKIAVKLSKEIKHRGYTSLTTERYLKEVKE